MEGERVLEVFIERKFHKRLLLPWNIAEDAVHDPDLIQKWVDTKAESYMYKEGDPVAHIGNLRLKMYISDFLWTKHIVEKNGNKSVQDLFSGVLCHWWEKQFNPYEKKPSQT